MKPKHDGDFFLKYHDIETFFDDEVQRVLCNLPPTRPPLIREFAITAYRLAEQVSVTRAMSDHNWLEYAAVFRLVPAWAASLLSAVQNARDEMHRRRQHPAGALDCLLAWRDSRSLFETSRVNPVNPPRKWLESPNTSPVPAVTDVALRQSALKENRRREEIMGQWGEAWGNYLASRRSRFLPLPEPR